MIRIADLIKERRASGHTAATPNQIANTPPLDGGGTPYGQAALTREAMNVMTAPEGTRNDTLNKAAYSLGQLVAARHIDGQAVTDQLTMAAKAAGLPDKEIESTLRSGGLAGAKKPRTVPDMPEPPAVTVIEATTQATTTPFTAPAPASQEEATTPPEEENTHTPTPEEQEAAYQEWRQAQITAQAEQLRISQEARDLVAREQAERTHTFPPHLPSVADELALPDEDIQYLIDDIFPVDSNVLLTAQYKTGKTTTITNFLRAFADQTPFLDTLTTHTNGERVVYLNYEVGEGQMRRWLRQAGFHHPERIGLLNVRGHNLPIVDDYSRSQLIDYLTAQQARCVVVDPYARAFVGNGDNENDNMQAGRFLDTWDQIKEKAGVRELIMVTHTGREQPGQPRQTRARGATRIDDWADVRWLLTRDPDTDHRFLSATGRDVEWPEHELTFDPDTKHLSAGTLDRYASRRNNQEDEVVRIIQEQPGITQNAILAELKNRGLGVRKTDLPGLIESARGHLRVYSTPGPRDSRLYHPTLENVG